MKIETKNYNLISHISFSYLIDRTLFVLFGVLILFVTAGVSGLTAHLTKTNNLIFIDFDTFYTAGKLALNGQIINAYQSDFMFKTMREFSGLEMPMLWSYPPAYTPFVAGLALLPRFVAYFIFITGSLIAYLYILKKLSGESYNAVRILVLPSILLNIVMGQNGLLISSLLGFFYAALLKNKKTAGLHLGLLTLKPHLAVSPWCLCALHNKWIFFFVGILVSFLISLIPTLIFGLGIWNAFFAGVQETGKFLLDGRFPLWRMNSLFSFLIGNHINFNISMALHIMGVLFGFIILSMMIFKKVGEHKIYGTSALLNSVISPYIYDYDMTLLGIPFSILANDLRKKIKWFEKYLLVFLSWFACGAPLIFKIITQIPYSFAISGIINWFMVLLILLIINRNEN